MQRLVGDLWKRHRCSVLLVTHDADEAVLLADRVVLLDSGRIARSWNVRFRRPRHVAAPGFATLKGALLEGLGMGHEHEARIEPTPLRRGA